MRSERDAAPAGPVTRSDALFELGLEAWLDGIESLR